MPVRVLLVDIPRLVQPLLDALLADPRVAVVGSIDRTELLRRLAREWADVLVVVGHPEESVDLLSVLAVAPARVVAVRPDGGRLEVADRRAVDRPSRDDLVRAVLAGAAA